MPRSRPQPAGKRDVERPPTSTFSRCRFTVSIFDESVGERDRKTKKPQASEADAAHAFDELSAAKAAEIASATSAIEAKTKRAGECAVEVVQTADDLEDTEADVAESQKFLADLDNQCASKKAEWSSRQQTRSDEVAAVSEAIL